MDDTWMSVLAPLSQTPQPPRPFVRRAPGDAADHGWLLSVIALAFLAGTIWLYWIRTGH
jgi:hypothetical protein